MLPLELGQEIEARVIEMLPDGNVMLDIGGTLLEANDPGSLEPGQRLRLRVDLLEPQLLLHIVEQELGLEAEVRKLLRQHLPVGKQQFLSALKSKIESSDGVLGFVYLEKLKNFLAELINNKEIMTPERLMQFVRDGGQHYEMKLLRAAAENSSDLAAIAKADLKGLLLGALDELDAASVLGESRRAIAGQLYDLEGQQAANLLAQIQSRRFQLQIPLFTGAGFTDVGLAIEADGKGNSEPKDTKGDGYSILFALDLEELGRIRIAGHLKRDHLQVVFYVEAGAALDLLKAELPRLRESMQESGFREVLLGARQLREMAPRQEAKFTSLSLGVSPDVQLLNVKV
jgi:Flagellar hook-length control protein FliK